MSNHSVTFQKFCKPVDTRNLSVKGPPTAEKINTSYGPFRAKKSLQFGTNKT